MVLTMGQEVIRNRQLQGALVNGWARILSCLHPLLSGTVTSVVCPKSLARSFLDAQPQASPPGPESSSLLGKRPRGIESDLELHKSRG